jgi:hypothetical protein
MRLPLPGPRRDRASRGTASKRAFAGRLHIAGSLAALVVALAGCGGSDDSVSIVNPTNGATVEPTFTVNVTQKGEGHLHFALDDGKYDHPKYSGPNGKLAVKLGVDGKYSPSTQPTITYQNIPAGPHKLEVFLAGNDHSNAGPKASVLFNVSPGQPGVSIDAPPQGSRIGGTFTARVTLENFEIDPSGIGKANEQGKGHLHFALDDGKFDHPKYSGADGRRAVKFGTDGTYSPAVRPRITYRHIPPGAHALEVYLANNDRSRAGAEAKTSFTVK